MLILVRAICAGLMVALLIGMERYCWMRYVHSEQRESLKTLFLVIGMAAFIGGGLLGQNLGSLLWALFRN